MPPSFPLNLSLSAVISNPHQSQHRTLSYFRSAKTPGHIKGANSQLTPRDDGILSAHPRVEILGTTPENLQDEDELKKKMWPGIAKWGLPSNFKNLGFSNHCKGHLRTFPVVSYWLPSDFVIQEWTKKSKRSSTILWLSTLFNPTWLMECNPHLVIHGHKYTAPSLHFLLFTQNAAF